MIVPFVGGAFKTFSKNLNPEECINFFPVVDKTGGKTSLALRGTPGLLEWLDLSDASELRNVIRYENYTYWVCGDAVYRVDEDKNKNTCEGSLRTDSGYVWMALNNAGQVMIVDGVSGYIITGTNFEEISDTDFPSGPNSLAFQDGYFIVTVEDSGRIYTSDLNDGTSWTSTMYGNAEARPDDSLALISDRDELVVLGENTKQSFRNTGATFPFQRLSGSTQTVGIYAPDSLKQFTNLFFWLSNDLQFVQVDGYGAKPISPPAIDYQISQMTDPSDCVSFGCIHQGNAFLVNQFKTDDQTWVYDVSTGFWHRRMSYPRLGRWRANCYVHFAGKHLVGDHSNGVIYELDYDTLTDDGEEIIRKRIAPVITKENKNIFHHQLEVFFEAGGGIQVDYQGWLYYDAQTGSFTVGNTIIGATSGTTATIVRVKEAHGTTGTLYLDDITGTFEDNEIIYEASYGADLVTDGDFGTPASFTTTGSAVIGSGVCTFDGVQTSTVYQAVSIEQDCYYIGGIKVNSVSGGISYIQGGGSNTKYYDINSTGTKTFCFTEDSASYNGNTVITAAINKLSELDDLSIKKITNAALANGTMNYHSAPQAMLRYSDDGGHTWSNEIWRSVGKLGEYETRARWNRLGSARNRVYELSMSDPVKWVVLGANLEAAKGMS